MAASRITLHCQVVVCPGLNDGSHLARTVEDLADLFPAAASVALVPVGLTAHREGLPPLTPPTPADARDLIATAERWQRAYRHRLGTRFVFPSDEFFLLANLPVPGAGYYEGFPLRENGVGMVRHFLREAGRLLRRLPATLPIPRHVTAVTGELAAPVLAPVIERLNRVASGQRLVIFALLASIAAVGLQAFIGDIAVVATLAASILAIVGVVRLAGGLGSSGVARFLYAVLMLVPLVNLILMVILSSRATKALREGGYRVGFLGAAQR